MLLSKGPNPDRMKFPKLTRTGVSDLWDEIPTSPTRQLSSAEERTSAEELLFYLEQQKGPPPLHHPDDLLRRLPVQILGTLFCAERVVMGTLVCRWMRQDLLTRQVDVQKMELRGPGHREVQAKGISKTLRFAQEASVSLRWEPCGNEKVFFAMVLGMADAASHSGFGRHLALLDLSNNALGDEQVRQLACVFQKAKCLTHLNLSNTCRGLTPSLRLCGASLRFCLSLQHLNLSNNDIGNKGAGRLASELQSCGGLQHLDLQYNKIQPLGVCKLAITMANFTTNLTHLNLSHNHIGDAGARGLALALSHCSGMQSLHLNYTKISDMGAFSLPLNQCPELSTLSLNNTRLSDVGMRNLVQKLSTCLLLRSLSIGSNHACGCHWAGGWGGSFFPGTLFLVLPGTILPIAQMNRGLTRLDLSGSGIGKQSVLNATMQFSHADGVARLAAAIAECGALEHLVLHDNNIQDIGVLGPVLAQLGALESLDMGANDVGCAGAEVLAGVLGRCSTLAQLRLGSNDVGDEGAGKLAEALCGGLLVLDLSCNRVREAGARRLAAALEGVGCKLRQLDLSWNAISRSGVGVLVSAHEQRAGGGNGGEGDGGGGGGGGGGEAGTVGTRRGLLLDLRGNYKDWEEEDGGCRVGLGRAGEEDQEDQEDQEPAAAAAAAEEEFVESGL